MKVELTKDDCYESLVDFYKAVANKVGILYNESSIFDCRRINVTKSCIDILKAFARETYRIDEESANMLMLMSGPKPCLSDDGYFAEIGVGFVMEG